MCNAFSMLLRVLLSITGVQECVLGCPGGPNLLQRSRIEQHGERLRVDWRGCSLCLFSHEKQSCQYSTFQVMLHFLPLSSATCMTNPLLPQPAPVPLVWPPCISAVLGAQHPRCCGRGAAAGCKCCEAGGECTVLQPVSHKAKWP